MQDTFLRIAGITIAVRCADARLTCRFEGAITRFFIDPAPPDVELDVVFLERYEEPRGDLLFDSGAVWKMYAEGDGVRVDCQADVAGRTPYKVTTFNRDFTRGTIRVNLSKPLDPLEFPLDELLVGNLLGLGRGVELHSCGIIDQSGQGHLFVGQSGAGKSTTARLWGDAAREIVSDDRVIIREDEGQLWMYGTPWHGEAELSSPARAPLRAVYLLTQAKENELRDLHPATAVARLFGCSFPQFHNAASIGFTMSMLERIVSRVPVREFRFTLDRAALELILGAAA
jgi:hypothetical protein